MDETTMLNPCSNAVPANDEGHIYALVTPIMENGWAFLGETDKYVTASSKRFTKFQGRDSVISIRVLGKTLNITKKTYNNC